jgi:outer membrane protein assembly factor BamD (BamD/ComL family)
MGIDARRWLIVGLLPLVLAGCRAGGAAPSLLGQRRDLPGTSISQAQSDAHNNQLRFEADDPTLFQRISHSMAPKNLRRTARTAIGLGPDEEIARNHYAQGERLFAEQKYNEAAAQFKSAADRWPDSALEEDALYMQAESYFFADRYYHASNVYTVLLKKYENSRHLDKIVVRHFAIGRYWEEEARGRSGMVPNFTDRKRPWFDQTGNAVAVYNSIRLNDPTGPLADDATMAIATTHFLNQRYEDASYHYDLVRKDHPNSEHQLQAHLLGLQSHMRAYQGAQYDGTTLKHADEIAKQTLTQFGRQLDDEERERVERARLILIAQRAERDLEAGDYYRRLGFNRSARIYYRDILTEYPGTPIAELAQQRLDAIADKPDDPPDYFWWLTRWFGEPTRRF